jgi:hypothetical protein
LDAGTLNAVAQTGECADCGEVRPRVEWAEGSVADWMLTRTHGAGGPDFIALRRSPAVGKSSRLAIASALVLTTTTAVLAGKMPAALGCLLSAGLLLLLLGPKPIRIELDRNRLVWTSSSGMHFSRSVPISTLVQFQVTAVWDPDRDDGKAWALGASLGPGKTVHICEFSTPSSARLVCDRLNEALFLALAQPSLGPYR